MCFGEAIDYKLWIVQPCRQDASGISRAQVTHFFLCPRSPVPSFAAPESPCACVLDGTGNVCRLSAGTGFGSFPFPV